ncbi:hypothetical protein EV421DRAFT_1742082 [Armillaria borealis]|uniref:Uncharacterized protein n=1 Tax=Armillaria borealis TaxID=47425 RepID=A0AA39IYG2_9AGAR|nr:hypothetical protein EV421DRAFT_1742082 [Armillaria borealis]
MASSPNGMASIASSGDKNLVQPADEITLPVRCGQGRPRKYNTPEERAATHMANQQAYYDRSTCANPTAHISGILAHFNKLEWMDFQGTDTSGQSRPVIIGPVSSRIRYQSRERNEGWMGRNARMPIPLTVFNKVLQRVAMSDIYTKTVDKVFEVFHHWAMGSCWPWLEVWLQAFCMECRKGRTFAYDFMDKEMKNYYTIYHWSLGLKDEPVLPCHNPSVVEELTEEEVQYKTQHENQMRGVLFRWWDKRASSLDALETSKPDFPLTSLLAEVSGIALWSKVSFSGAVQEDFGAWFAASGLLEKSQTVERG